MKVNVISCGDSTNPSVWSNVPYCLTQALEQAGHDIRRVDISVEGLGNFWCRVAIVWNGVLRRLCKIVGARFSCWFEWSPLYYYLAERKLRTFFRKSGDVDINLWISFVFPPSKHKNIKGTNILFHDWTQEFHIECQCHQNATLYEKRYLFPREREAINSADYVFVMFKNSAEYIKRQIRNPEKVHYLNRNVVNDVAGLKIGNEAVYISKKSNSRMLLFVGRRKYIESAQLLVNIFPLLKSKWPDATLHFVGIEKHDVKCSNYDGVYFYGWLDKGSDKDRDVYYSLMQNSTVFINTTSVWGGYSSTIEAMYYYTPVIVYPYREFVEEFGEIINFGSYVYNDSSISLLDSITSLFETNRYDEYAKSAHIAVQDYSWHCYIADMFSIVEKGKC